MYYTYLQPNRAVVTPYKIALDIPLFHKCTVIVVIVLVIRSISNPKVLDTAEAPYEHG